MSQTEFLPKQEDRELDVRTVDERDADDATEPTRSVVVPVYAEEPAVWTGLVDDLLAAGWDEVVVCADAPDPETRAALDRVNGWSGVRLSVSESRRGKGGALIAGLEATSAGVVGYVDADGAVAVRELNCVYRLVERGHADVAVGSRGVPGNGRDGQSAIRRTLASSYRWLARRLTGVPVQDFQCGAKAFTREVWEAVVDDLQEYEFAFDTEVIARAYHHGFRIREVSIAWRDPGESDVRVHRDVPSMLSSLVRIRQSLTETARRRRDEGAVTRVALVSAHPPNRGHLAEYGEQLARAYAARDDVELTVLSPATGGGPPDERRDGYTVRRVWERDSLRSALGLLREVRTGDYDVVQFNVHMTYFGDRNAYRFVGLALPALIRLGLNATVITTLHDLLEVVEADAVDENVGPVKRFGASVATQLAVLSDVTTVTAAEYREIIEERYRFADIYHVPHGTFGSTGDPTLGLAPPLRVMVFGHLSPTKDVATVVEAFSTVREHVPDAELWIAGDSHPDHPGHRERLEREYGDRPGVVFTGYVEDDDLDDIWETATLTVMPYRTTTGVSGVFQLAKTYGTSVVAYDTEGLYTSTVETGGTASFVPPGDADALAGRIVELWTDRDSLREMGRENAAAADEYTVADAVDRVIDIVEEDA